MNHTRPNNKPHHINKIKMENTWNFTPVPTNKVDMKYDIDKLLCQEMPTEYLKDRLRILKAMNNYVNPEYLVELERSENKIKCDKLNFISINSNCIEVLSRFLKITLQEVVIIPLEVYLCGQTTLIIKWLYTIQHYL